MHEIQAAAGRVVANDTQNCVAAVDQAVMSLAQLCSSIVEVSSTSRLPIATVQAALANAGDGLANLIESRGKMSAATRELVLVQMESNLREVSFGCPGGFPKAQRDAAPVASSQAA